MPLLLKLRGLGGCCRLTRRLLYPLGRIEWRSYRRSYICRERGNSQGCYISGAISRAFGCPLITVHDTDSRI
jgi:hypothetical protein